MDVKCEVTGCDRSRHASQFCGMHYARWKRHGETGGPSPIAHPTFESQTTPSDTGCLLWVGSITTDGYGKFHTAGRTILAHRWAYLTTVGEIPEGLELDHLCRVRSCVNVLHLEAVTRQVNATRGVGFAGQNARKTHCPKGHPYQGANLYVSPVGSRVCRTCKATNSRAYRAKEIPSWT